MGTECRAENEDEVCGIFDGTIGHTGRAGVVNSNVDWTAPLTEKDVNAVTMSPDAKKPARVCNAASLEVDQIVETASGDATSRSQPKRPPTAWASSGCSSRVDHLQTVVQLFVAPLSASGRREQSGRRN